LFSGERVSLQIQWHKEAVEKCVISVEHLSCGGWCFVTILRHKSHININWILKCWDFLLSLHVTLVVCNNILQHQFRSQEKDLLVKITNAECNNVLKSFNIVVYDFNAIFEKKNFLKIIAANRKLVTNELFHTKLRMFWPCTFELSQPSSRKCFD
jgi:hypothetical protein